MESMDRERGRASGASWQDITFSGAGKVRVSSDGYIEVLARFRRKTQIDEFCAALSRRLKIDYEIMERRKRPSDGHDREMGQHSLFSPEGSLEKQLESIPVLFSRKSA